MSNKQDAEMRHSKINKKGQAGSLDQHIGAMVRKYRLIRAWTQTRLAGELGLTFQQLQKYEKGQNRISAAALYRISKVLDVHLELFYGEWPLIGSPEVSFMEFNSSDMSYMKILKTPENGEFYSGLKKITSLYGQRR